MLPSIQPTIETAVEFLRYLQEWRDHLMPMTLEEVIQEAGSPEKVAIFSVDLINGFCHEGRLQSDRVKAILNPVTDLMQCAYQQGVRHFVLTQDSHPPDAVEFNDFPVHCVRGTSEAETAPELMALPCAHLFTTLPKLSISSGIRTGLDGWLEAHPQVTHRIVVGDCTDLCTYQLAMHLKLTSNVRNVTDPVIVPANCVDTYDVEVDFARDLGIKAHPGDFFHDVFLYHMALNGIRVVGSLE